MTNISNLNLTKGTIPPLLKYKIVFLGDQAVGKSSIINRFIYDIFDGNEHVKQSLSVEAHHRDRFHFAEHLPVGENYPFAAVGHSRTGKIPFPHPQLHPGLLSGCHCLRCHQQGLLQEYAQVDRRCQKSKRWGCHYCYPCQQNRCRRKRNIRRIRQKASWRKWSYLQRSQCQIGSQYPVVFQVDSRFTARCYRHHF